jgi:excisionase family DNA binding protein
MDDPLKATSDSLSLRPREAAAALGVSISTLERITKSGALPCVKLGRAVLYPVSSLKQFLHFHTQVVKGREA